MATGTLTSTTIAATYKSLLKVKGGANQVLEAGSTAHYLEDGDGNDSVLALSQAFVGIGTEATLALLSVGAIATLVTDGTTAVTPEGMNVHITEESKYAMGIKNAHISGDGLLIHAGHASDDFALRIEDYDSATDLLCVLGDGKTGIGTASPNVPLDISAGSEAVALKIGNTERIVIGGWTSNSNHGPFITAASTGSGWMDIVTGYQDTHDAPTGMRFGIASGGGWNAKLQITSADGDTLPGGDRTQDLGSLSYEWDQVHCVNATEVSDVRLKESIETSPLGLEFVNKLRPVKYKMKTYDYDVVYENDGKTETHTNTFNRKHYGLIAQEVKAVLDDMNIDTSEFGGYVDGNINEGVDKLALRYREFIAPMIKAIQELSSKVDALENIN